MNAHIVVGLFFKEVVSVVRLEESYLEHDMVLHKNHPYYFVEDVPGGFELGFYHWLLHGPKLIGVNFTFNEPDVIMPFFKDKQHDLLRVEADEIFVLFEKEASYEVEQVAEFICFYLLQSEEGTPALTFALPVDDGYDLTAITRLIDLH